MKREIVLIMLCCRAKLRVGRPDVIVRYLLFKSSHILSTTAALIFFGSVAMAQSTPTATTRPAFKPVPPAAEAYSFGKYGDTPVGLYTGIPNISVPLYTLAMKGIKIPITLTYHAGGIKVDELASNVGLGWTLNTGGGITSSVNGSPDQYGGWLGEIRKLPQSGTLQTSWGPFDSYATDSTYLLLLGASKGIIDTQPDLFYVNMNGRSFKYYFDQGGNIFTVPYQRVKFLNSWTIVDETDTKFTFGTDETTTTNYSNGGEDIGDPSYSHNSNYPSQFVTPHKDTVSYEYENYSYNFDNQPAGTRYALSSVSGCAVAQPAQSSTESTTYVTGKRIKKIKGNNGIEINFTYGAERLDLPGAHVLAGVEVKNTDLNQVLLSYTLSYDYYGAGSSSDDYRLRLVSVQKAGENPYVFEYNATPLPERLSKAQDHWGFYNGSGNSMLFPVNTAFNLTTGGNREPSEYYTKAGILIKITYPAKGYTQFDYESNQYVESSVTKITGGLRIKSITDHPITGSPVTKHYEYPAIANHMPIPEYIYTYNKRHVEGEAAVECQFYAQASSSIVPLGVNGGTVAYSEVKVYTEDQAKGYTHHRFSHFGNSSGNQGFPFAPVINYDWVDGLPLETTDYLWDAANSVYRPVKKVANQYKTAYGSNGGNLSNPHEYAHRGAKVALVIAPIAPYPPVPGGPVGPVFVVIYYDLYSSWSYPTQTRETIYDPADTTKKVITETKWYYDNPLHANVTRQEITKTHKTTNEKYNIRLVYPQDYNSLYPYNASPVVEKRVMINTGGTDRLVDAELTTYLNQPGSFPENYYSLNISDPVAPSTVPVYTGTSVNGSYEKRNEYLYDGNNNVVTFITDNVSKRSVKWGYRKQYPVVEIMNAGAGASFTTPGIQMKHVTIPINGTSKTESFVTTSAATANLTINSEPGEVFQLNYVITQGSTIITSGTLCVDRVNFPSSCSFPESVTTATLPAGSYDIYIEYQSGSNLSFTKTISVSYQGTVTSSSGDEFYYEGFEEGSHSTTLPHTGLQSYSGDFTVNWTRPGARSYVITYWYREALTGIWKFKEKQEYSGPTMTLADGDAIDDIRIFPADATMNTYTYNAFGAISSIIDSKGMTTYYEYDTLQRLKSIKDQKGRIMTHYDYNFKQ